MDLSEQDSRPVSEPTLASSLSRRGAASYNRRRAGNACIVCRARKTRCDNERPSCGFCVATEAHCQYDDAQISKLDRSSILIIERIAQLEYTLLGQIHASRQGSSDRSGVYPYSSNQNLHSTAETWYTSPSSSEIYGFVQENSPVTEEVHSTRKRARQEFAPPTQLVEDDAPPSTEILLHASEMSLNGIIRWPIFRESSRRRSDSLSKQRLIGILANHDEKARQLRETPSTFPNLDSATIDHFVENFLTNNHIKNPILDIEQVRNDARWFMECGPEWDGRSCLILLICAVSALSAPLEEEAEPGPSKTSERFTRADAYFQASQKRIGMLHHEHSLTAVQCSFLTGVYHMLGMHILAAWKSFAQAGAQCLAWLASNGWFQNDSHGIVLDRRSGARHVIDSVYWSCLKTEQELSFELGLPSSGLNQIPYPHLFPSPPSEVSEHDLNFPVANVRTTVIDQQNLQLGWYFYLAEIALRRSLNRCLVWRYASKCQISEADEFKGISEYDLQVQDWYKALPTAISFDTNATVPSKNILSCILRCHMIDHKLLLRFPAIKAFLGVHGLPWLALSPRARQLTSDYLYLCVQHLDANRENYFHRHQGTWLMLRSCSRSALILAAAAWKCRTMAITAGPDGMDMETEVMPHRWKGVVEEFRDKVLEYWADEAPAMEEPQHILRELSRLYETACNTH